MQQRRPGFPARLPGAAAPTPARPAPAAPPARHAAAPSPVGVGLDSAAVRARMVQKLAAGGITSPAVLQAMGAVERHRFVDSALVNQAYEDTSLPIGLGQTISKPNVVARMCELLLGSEGARSGGLGRVLEIGTGCGYQAAVLSHLAREVYTLERLRGLHDKARGNLRPFRLANVHLLFGDGMLGYAKGAPYAAIIAAAGGDAVPQAWCDQLAVGGRLVAPMAVAGGQQMLLVIDKTPHGLKQNVLEPVHFVPLKSGVA
ncbi:protein-L-isoaspartate(D-aspartate) O-methyltransferase [Acidovorax sp. sic0104]|uniref:protein-L-isoaspartate(D-aspartate) O-methyltransferase n=1 Tax=Acidovorax sp. sic0104 TaxID=2854784 RepID=UPI001C48D881|nr:protein-L-isoaspartate(D-aspartate) O-methyltransferase [Acidovorax sp. sic0104]MBV7544077.1 protein-L-isoaspartate(D-aspartate) O-methyltransferase [Acidovorax sp. sic0104]